MSSNEVLNGTTKFERMTKEEKLRFCQDLIKQAANLNKSSDIGEIRSIGTKTHMNSARSKSKSSKRPASSSGTISKKTKSATVQHDERSKSYGKPGTAQRSTSKSSKKSSKSHTV